MADDIFVKMTALEFLEFVSKGYKFVYLISEAATKFKHSNDLGSLADVRRGVYMDEVIRGIRNVLDGMNAELYDVEAGRRGGIIRNKIASTLSWAEGRSNSTERSDAGLYAIQADVARGLLKLAQNITD